MGRKIRQALLGNIWIKLLSLLIAIGIWFMVSNANDPARTTLFPDVPVTIVNQDSVADIGKVIEVQSSGTVTLRVTEKKSVLERLNKTGSDFYVEADMNNLTDMNTVPLTVSCSNQAITWDEIEMMPSSLKVTLEDKVEQTYIASVSAEGAPAGGWEVGSCTISEGKNIVIAGPGSLINIINQVVAPVNVDGLMEDAAVSSTLKIYDKNGDTFTDAQLASLEFKDENGNVLTNHTVEVQVDLWRIVTDIPIRVQTAGYPAWGYRVSGIKTIPETISVAGTEDALTAIGATFEVFEQIDVNGLTEDVSREIDLTEQLANTPGLKLINDSDPTVQVEVAIEANGDVTLTIPLSSISFANKPEGMDLVFTPADEVIVKVHALQEDAQKLSSDALSLSVDLSPCAVEGSYEIPVQVTFPEGYELASDVTLTVISTSQAVQTEGEQG